jgi:integrase/recombinase XerD
MAGRRFHVRSAAQQRKELLADPAAPGALRSLWVGYLAHIQVRHFTPQTIGLHRRLIRVFVEWAEERAVHDAAQVTAGVLERYQRWLYHQYRQANGQPLTISAQRTRLRIVVSFFSWAVRQHHLPANPAADLEMPRATHALPRFVLARSDVAAILAQPDLTTPKGLRDRAMLELLYSTGMRRTELAGLKLYDIERERGLILIREGKGRRDRYLPLGAAALAWIDRYLAEVRPQIVTEPDAGFLFVNCTGEPLGSGGLGYELRQYITAAGITHRGSCHLFRHACATHLLEAGCDIRFIQEMLGHAKLDTTAIYTRVTVSTLKAMHARFHPSEALEADPSPSPAAEPCGAHVTGLRPAGAPTPARVPPAGAPPPGHVPR